MLTLIMAGLLVASFLAAGAARAQNLGQAQGLANADQAYAAKEYGLALARYQVLADRGKPRAQYILGLMYYQGQGTERNGAKAAEWFLRAARQGEPHAQYELGVMYTKGDIVQRDYAQAIKWFLQAAKREHMQAEYNLAVMYLQGSGVVESSRTAAQWFRRAANQDFAAAQYQLGLLALQGRGVPQDFVEAHKWWQLASAGGFARAARALSTLTGELSSYELEEAARRVAEWREQYAPDTLQRAAAAAPRGGAQSSR